MGVPEIRTLDHLSCLLIVVTLHVSLHQLFIKLLINSHSKAEISQFSYDAVTESLSYATLVLQNVQIKRKKLVFTAHVKSICNIFCQKLDFLLCSFENLRIVMLFTACCLATR